jgi:hypothetical protein
LCRKTKPIIINKRIRITINACKKKFGMGKGNISSIEQVKKKKVIKNSEILWTEKI